MVFLKKFSGLTDGRSTKKGTLNARESGSPTRPQPPQHELRADRQEVVTARNWEIGAEPGVQAGNTEELRSRENLNGAFARALTCLSSACQLTRLP
jgi:hypothetical protein